MAFAISYSSNSSHADAEKERIVSLITGNGGLVLEDGFEELFDLPDMSGLSGDIAAKSPTHVGNEERQCLTLKPKHHDLCFAATITDCHNRRAKYMQALALDLPTLSGRWIIDSLDPARNATLGGDEQRPLSWARYLLPAGESQFLDGAVHSRTLSPYDAMQHAGNLLHIVNNRPALLKGEGVLMIAPKKGSKGWERRKTFTFLTLALGAASVRRVAQLEDARELIAAEPAAWKWVYVDSSIAEAAGVLFNRGKSAGAKRRGQGSEAVKTGGHGMFATDGHVKLVNNEFVIQSLITGALVD